MNTCKSLDFEARLRAAREEVVHRAMVLTECIEEEGANSALTDYAIGRLLEATKAVKDLREELYSN